MRAAFEKIKSAHCLLLALLLLSGCKYFSESTPQYLISLHELLETQDAFATQQGRVVWDAQLLRQARVKAPFLSAKYFYQAEIMPSDDERNCGIRLYIDRFGRSNLLQTTAQNRGRQFAVLVDGFFIGLSRFPERLDGAPYLELDPLWNTIEAEQIVNCVNENYRQLN